MRKKILTGAILTGLLAAAACGHKGPESASANQPVGYSAASNAQPAPQPPPPPNAYPVNPQGNPEPVAAPDPVAPPASAPVAPPPPAVGEPSPTVSQLAIPAGTRIRVRLGQTLDTKFSRSGEHFVAYLDEPIVSGDRVIVPKGAEFQGHVTMAKPSGRLKGRAYLGLRLDSFQLQGVRYDIRTNDDMKVSRNHKRRNVAIIGGGAGAGAGIGALAGGGVGALIGAGAGAVAGTTGAVITGKKNIHLPVESVLAFSVEGGVHART